MSRGKVCAVEPCERTASVDLPLDDEHDLDVRVCAEHHDEIEADPAGWRVTSVPLKGSTKERLIVERVE